MIITPESLREFWLRASPHKAIFGTDVSGDFNKFVNIFLSMDDKGMLNAKGLFWVVDDFVGVFYMNKIEPAVDASLHYAFFDRRMNGRIDLCFEMLRFIFDKYQLRRVSVEIPTYSSPHTSYITENVIGFRYEGRKRSSRFYANKWFDVKYYGLLRHEFDKLYETRFERMG